MFEHCTWLNEPASWRIDEGRLEVTTDHGTDFWRETHYGFIRDNGHFLAYATDGDFTAELKVRGNYTELYDQAGMMVRIDAEHWVKAGIELTDEIPGLGSVLTLPRSDWATGIFAGDPREFWIRATVAKGVLKLQSSFDGRQWPTLRLAAFPKAGRYLVGPMCCTPERAGLEVTFLDFRVGPPLEKGLHDLTY